MPYVYVITGPNRIEDGTFEVSGDEARVEHTGGGASKCKLAPGEDPKIAARRLLRERANERGSFYDPINYRPSNLV